MTSRRDGFSGLHTFSRRYGYEPLPKPMRLETNKHRQAGEQGSDSQ